MAVIHFNRFDLGIDTRKGPSVSDANRLLQMKNAYVTTGMAAQKRAGLVKVAVLEAGTKGLFAAFGKLNTFYGSGTITHANTLFKANKVQYSGGAQAVADVAFADVFNGFIYTSIEYADGKVEHHYLDDYSAWAAKIEIGANEIRTPTVKNSLRYVAKSVNSGVAPWVGAKAYVANDSVKPVKQSALRYTCDKAGTSGSAEPSWPTTNGATVVDGGVTWTCHTKASTTTSEPVWPTVAGQKVSDGLIEWETQTSSVLDTNCPHTKAVIKAASKIFAAGAGDGDVVRYCSTGNPRDWTSTNDAGFLPTGLNSRGDRSTNALGIYQGNLVALSKDGAQVWVVDPDPTKMSLKTIVENVGTSFPMTVYNVAGDLYFLSDYGFRSITTLQYTNNLADVDVGSPIDSLVKPETTKGIKPRSFYFYGTGQYICAIANRLFVYSISRTSKIAAWSEYFLSKPVDAFASLGQILYIRSGDAVYKLDETVKADDSVQYEMLVQLPYMDFKKPGSLKHVYAIDVVVDGSCYVSIGFDARDADAFTSEVKVKGNTRGGGLIPIECTGTEFSVRFRNIDDQPLRIDAVDIYYDDLGVIA